MQRVRQTYVYGILGGEPPNIWSYTFIYVVYVVYIIYSVIYTLIRYIYTNTRCCSVMTYTILSFLSSKGLA